jgi:hypothetical protein
MLRAGFRVPVFATTLQRYDFFLNWQCFLRKKIEIFSIFFCFYSVPFVFRRFPAMSAGLPAQPGLVWANQCQERIGCRFASLHPLPSWRTRSAISCAFEQNRLIYNAFVKPNDFFSTFAASKET